jgi:hypothetical protein
VLRVLRLVLRLALAFFAIGAVIGIGAPQTGPLEKAAFALLFVAIALVSIPVGHIGEHAS